MFQCYWLLVKNSQNLEIHVLVFIGVEDSVVRRNKTVSIVDSGVVVMFWQI